jgi:rod shape-determining protein MreC
MEYLRRNRILLASASLLVCSLLLVSVSVRAGHRDPVGRLLLDALAPFQVVFSWIGRGTGRLWSGYVNVVDARHEADELRARVAVLEGQLARLSEAERENQRLGALLHFREQLPATAYGARVIARDPGPSSTTMTIDRGSRDGVAHGMAVVAPEGVIGRVVEVSYTVSRVALLTDHNSGIDAIVDRTRARGVLQGGSDGNCYMNYLNRDADVKVGDRVLTSGLDNVFPKGMSIGQVVDVGRKHRGLLQSATVLPSVALDRVEEVMLVAPTAPPAGEPPA